MFSVADRASVVERSTVGIAAAEPAATKADAAKAAAFLQIRAIALER